MPNINSLTYNGTKSTDLGVYVTGSGSFDAAEMDADKYEIAGRNGDLIIPKNRYKNIVVTYPAFIPKAFQGKAQSIRNWMRSAKAYARLEDTYDMEHYRLGLASGIQSFEPVNRNDASNFQLSFDCRPERFLKTGETPLTIEPEAHSYSGEIVSFETVAVDDMTKAEVSLMPKQSLNGYDHPWPAGGGTNKYDDAAKTGGLIDANGNVATITTWWLSDYCPIPVGTTAITLSWESESPFYQARIVAYDSSKSLLSGSYAAYTDSDVYSHTFTIPNTAAFVRVNFSHVINGNERPRENVRVNVGSADLGFSPYENLCPISGHTGATLSVTGKNLWKFNASYQSASSGTLISNQAYVLNVGTYTLSMKGAIGAAMDVTFRDSGNNVIVTKTLNSASFVDGYCSTEITLDRQSAKLNIYSSGAYDISEIQLEVGTTAHTYAEPTAVHSYPVSFSSYGTVYGGTFDWVSGKLKVEWANIASYNGETITEPWLSSLDPYVAGTTPTTGAQVVYKLATPLEYTLTPAQISTLNGLNNVWASDGTVEINYADPFNVDNPTYFEARPLFEITNPAQNDVLNVNGKTITFLSSYTGTVTIDCETMNCYSGYANMNYLISATDFPVLNEGLNIVTWSGSGTCTMTPRWWEL